MNVKLVSITAGAGELLNKSAQELIAYTARVSNPSNQDNTETAPKLIKYLIKNKHWSPLEMAHMTIEITTSRAVAQQILRHRSFSFQEFSQRYAEATEFETYSARRQDLKNRQNSIDDLDRETKAWFYQAQQVIQEQSQNLYEQALNKNIAKEQARFLLPLSTQTRLYMSGSVRSWVHYLELRTGNGTQLEHKEIALEIQKIFMEQFPNVATALGWSYTI
jgi:thymidylate synthase (FAD)